MKFNYFKNISQEISLADFTDGTDATGYVDLDIELPAGAIPIAWEAQITEAFAGTTDATLQVGTTTDVDAFSVTTDGDATTAARIVSSALAPSAATDRTIRVTLTDTKSESPDFGDFTEATGAFTLKFISVLPE